MFIMAILSRAWFSFFFSSMQKKAFFFFLLDYIALHSVLVKKSDICLFSLYCRLSDITIKLKWYCGFVGSFYFILFNILKKESQVSFCKTDQKAFFSFTFSSRIHFCCGTLFSCWSNILTRVFLVYWHSPALDVGLKFKSHALSETLANAFITSESRCPFAFDYCWYVVSVISDITKV